MGSDVSVFPHDLQNRTAPVFPLQVVHLKEVMSVSGGIGRQREHQETTRQDPVCEFLDILTSGSPHLLPTKTVREIIYFGLPQLVPSESR